MAQFKKDWSAHWNGHLIRVENRAIKWQQIETHLLVDGALIQNHQGDLWHPNTGCEGEFEDETGTHKIRIKFYNSSSVSALCHIYVNDELIGGDKQTPLPATEADFAERPVAEQKKFLKRMLLIQIVAGFTLFPLLYLLLSFVLHKESFDPFMYIVMCNVLISNMSSTAYKLLKLSRQNPNDTPKNSTPV